MNLDLDDPLGDLLSEGSNDSFFGIEPVKKAVPKTEKKDEKQAGKKMEQLFGISEEKAEPIKAKPSEFKLFSNSELASPVKSVPKRTATSGEAQRPSKPTVDDFRQIETKSNDSLSSELGFDPKKPRKKGSILDELLGIGEGFVTSSKSQLPLKSTAREATQATMKATISRQTTSETISEIVNAENPSGGRKPGRRQSAVVFSDPLGLFGPSEREKEQIKKAQTKAARKSIAGSEWLFNDPSQEKSSPPFTKLKSSPAIQITPNSEEKHDDEPASSNVTSLESKNTLTNQPMTSSHKNQPQLIESLVSDTTNTLNNMKQQEFQLMVATQMKTQENVLIEMKNKQQELLKQQEHQFNELLKKQIGRQSELEEVIRNQQERINNHIQALMASHAQSPFLDNLMISSKPLNESQTVIETNPLEKVELEADVKRLEMEKLRLEDLLSNISDNHEKEIVMIEKSYKKRLQLMEENLESMEQRYKSEIAAVEKFFSDKVKSISDERDSNLETLKLHYEEMMENVRKSKFMEFAIREESSSYVDILKRASSNLETASGDVHSLHEVLQEKLIVLERDKEIQLSSREKRLEEQQKLLERTREMSEAEREKLLELVQTLELKLNSIEQKSDEEQWSLKQKLISFEVERKSFEKEKDFLRSQIASEQQKVQELKQSQLNEHAKLLQEIERERLKLQEDRARMEVAKSLQTKSDESGLSRAEIDVAVKYAEDFARESEKQRQRLIEMQRVCEAKRHELMDQENNLRAKQSELENSIIRTKQKERQAENVLKQTKKTELMLIEKYQSLQKYTLELSERETKIAKERLDVNQDKLSLQSQRKKLSETRCSLCKIGDKANELKGIMQKTTTDFDDINVANNHEQLNFESFSGNFSALYSQEQQFMPSVDLENVPNLTDMDDDFLDSDLLMLKFDVLNSNRSNFNSQNPYKDF